MESNRVTTASLLIIVVFIIGVVLKLAKPVLFPFFIAIFISFLIPGNSSATFNPLISFTYYEGCNFVMSMRSEKKSLGIIVLLK